MHRHDLHGVVVALHAAADEFLIVSQREQSHERGEQFVGSAAAPRPMLVQQLHDVREIGKLPLPLGPRRDAGHDRGVRGDLGGRRGDPAMLHNGRQLRDHLLNRTDGLLGQRPGVAEGMVAEELCDRRSADAAGAGRPLHRLEQSPHVTSHAAPHDARRAGRHGTDPKLRQFGGNLGAHPVGPNDHADIAGRHRPRAALGLERRGRRGEQLDDLAHGRKHDRGLFVGLPEVKQFQRRRPDDPRLAISLIGTDRLVGDRLAVERGTVHHRVEGLDQRPIRPPVHQQRPPLGRAREVDVGPDIGAAEPIDRLLWIADGDQAATVLAGKERAEKLPLQRRVVLGLVDDREGESLPQLRHDRGAACAGNDVPGKPQQVVEARL